MGGTPLNMQVLDQKTSIISLNMKEVLKYEKPRTNIEDVLGRFTSELFQTQHAYF